MADKSILESIISDAESKNESDYTTSSWDDMQAVLLRAIETFEDPTADQQQVDDVVSELQVALDALKSVDPEEPEEKDPKNSILTSIKKMLGIEPEYEHFDTELILHINSVFFTLLQLGLGPEEGFMIEDETVEWTDFLGDRKDLNAVRTYIYLRVRLLFDPPQMGYLVESIKKQADELEWRLNVQAEGSQKYEKSETKERVKHTRRRNNS